MGLKFVYDKLTDGLLYPCVTQDFESWLGWIPAGDSEGVTVVRLSSQRRRDTVDGLYLRGRITLFFAMAPDLSLSLPSEPTKRRSEVWTSWGALPRLVDDRWRLEWEDLDSLKRYVRFVFFHEMGHHVYRRGWLGGNKTGTGAGESKEEAFANDYALRFLDNV